MIYIREKDEVLSDFAPMLKDLLLATFLASPSIITYKHFFSFFREIFYYYRDMDRVDSQLACDAL